MTDSVDQLSSESTTPNEPNASEESHAPLPSEGDLIRQGWISPARVKDLLATMDLIAEGAFLDVPKDDDELGRAFRDLALSVPPVRVVDVSAVGRLTLPHVFRFCHHSDLRFLREVLVYFCLSS